MRSTAETTRSRPIKVQRTGATPESGSAERSRVSLSNFVLKGGARQNGSRVGAQIPLRGSTPTPLSFYFAPVAQWADAIGLSPIQCQFESGQGNRGRGAAGVAGRAYNSTRRSFESNPRHLV